MVNQHEVDLLTQQLQSLRGTVVRDGRVMATRVDHVLREAKRLHKEAQGTDYEPALRSVENLLVCVKRGLTVRCNLDRKLRHAG